MSVALKSEVLVLNKSWSAVRIIQAGEALADLFTGRVEAVDTDYQCYDFHTWRELSEYAATFEPENHSFISTVKDQILVPAVVRLLRFERVRASAIRLSRRNIYLRDNYTCQYTGEKLPASELNLDHVMPVSRGGRTTWDNLVCCSVEVNTRKGNKTPEEAGLKLIRQPKKPDPESFLFKRFSLQSHKRHASWKQFVDAAYWNTELND